MGASFGLVGGSVTWEVDDPATRTSARASRRLVVQKPQGILLGPLLLPHNSGSNNECRIQISRALLRTALPLGGSIPH